MAKHEADAQPVERDGSGAHSAGTSGDRRATEAEKAYEGRHRADK